MVRTIRDRLRLRGAHASADGDRLVDELSHRERGVRTDAELLRHREVDAELQLEIVPSFERDVAGHVGTKGRGRGRRRLIRQPLVTEADAEPRIDAPFGGGVVLQLQTGTYVRPRAVGVVPRAD